MPIACKKHSLQFLTDTGAAAADKARGSAGSSLMEMVIVLAILSLLAAMAAPYARMSLKRDKEIRLRETLRAVRTAIDRYHDDAAKESSGGGANAGAGNGEGAGYPRLLQMLADGVEGAASGTPAGKKKRKRYLRSLPINPFAPPGTPFEAQWTFVYYQSEASGLATSSYGATLAETGKREKEIYDLHAATPEIALDGTRYADW